MKKVLFVVGPKIELPNLKKKLSNEGFKAESYNLQNVPSECSEYLDIYFVTSFGIMLPAYEKEIVEKLDIKNLILLNPDFDEYPDAISHLRKQYHNLNYFIYDDSFMKENIVDIYRQESVDFIAAEMKRIVVELKNKEMCEEVNNIKEECAVKSKTLNEISIKLKKADNENKMLSKKIEKNSVLQGKLSEELNRISSEYERRKHTAIESVQTFQQKIREGHIASKEHFENLLLAANDQRNTTLQQYLSNVSTFDDIVSKINKIDSKSFIWLLTVVGIIIVAGIIVISVPQFSMMQIPGYERIQDVITGIGSTCFLVLLNLLILSKVNGDKKGEIIKDIKLCSQQLEKATQGNNEFEIKIKTIVKESDREFKECFHNEVVDLRKKLEKEEIDIYRIANDKLYKNAA